MRVAVLTQIPSPYQIELFDAVAARGAISVAALYLDTTSPGRDWQMRTLGHEGLVVTSDAVRHKGTELVDAADLVVFGDYTYPCARAWLARRASSRKPWCFWGERPGVHVKGWPGRLLRRLRLGRLRASRAPIWGIGNWAVEGYRAEFDLEREYFNIPYFSDLARFQRAAALGGEARSRGRRLLFSGALIRRKGIDLLARAFRRISPSHPDLELHLLGAGPLRRRIEQILSGLESRVRFHGFQDWDDLPAHYARADILCVPSRYDGWGLVVPEGLAAGLPVIASTQMGAARELLSHGGNGWLVSPGELESLVAALDAAASLTEEQLHRMRRAAVDSVASHQLADGARRFEEAALRTAAAWRA